jgi:hypothetical protein
MLAVHLAGASDCSSATPGDHRQLASQRRISACKSPAVLYFLFLGLRDSGKQLRYEEGVRYIDNEWSRDFALLFLSDPLRITNECGPESFAFRERIPYEHIDELISIGLRMRPPKAGVTYP